MEPTKVLKASFQSFWTMSSLSFFPQKPKIETRSLPSIYRLTVLLLEQTKLSLVHLRQVVWRGPVTSNLPLERSIRFFITDP
mmetsp:Transcript_12403/g.50802  ORF Transcript_12403/g.50802 Transcript_12403/m.50802 type:complete len:82 (-) Transcript_12403:781-1026(-)